MRMTHQKSLLHKYKGPDKISLKKELDSPMNLYVLHIIIQIVAQPHFNVSFQNFGL